VEAYPSLDAALAAAGDDCFVIGGERVYRDAMARATRLHLTHVDVECDGDTFFPEFDTAEWECVEASDPVVENGHTFVFRTYDRLPSLYLHAAARSDAQAQHMADLEAARVCIFCPEHVGAYAREPVEVEGEHWYVKKNDYPYDGASAHYLIVARRHVRSFDELPDEAGAELWAIKRKLRAQLDPLAIATVERSGDMRYNGGSVAHLHVHFVALDAIPGTPVRFRVSGHATGDAETPPTSSPGSET
jgi:diadenosine tetraphosphate (Ap4A) HIT family hydrolase